MGEQPRTGTETAVLGGGCFWCTEAALSQLDGVLSIRPGYAGGTTRDPGYEAVCTGSTGHAEVVEIVFDPSRLPFRDLLEVFFASHDPTTPNRQGNDVGTQYRSVVFCRDAAQQQAARAVIAELGRSGAFPAPIVTEIGGDVPFYPAEAYHFEYFAKNATAPYCAYVVAPKVAKIRARFAGRLKQREAAG